MGVGKPDGTGKGTATEDSNRKGDRAGEQTQGKTKESMKARSGQHTHERQ